MPTDPLTDKPWYANMPPYGYTHRRREPAPRPQAPMEDRVADMKRRLRADIAAKQTEIERLNADVERLKAQLAVLNDL